MRETKRRNVVNTTNNPLAARIRLAAVAAGVALAGLLSGGPAAQAQSGPMLLNVNSSGYVRGSGFPMSRNTQGGYGDQNGGGQQANPLVGSWHQVQQAQVGGTIHSFWQYNANGTFFMSFINEGGGSNGLRTQFCGNYTITSQLPPTWQLQSPPPLNIPSGGGSASGYTTPTMHPYQTPHTTTGGIMGNCDDLQVSRVCTINDGVTYRDRNTGCLVCTK